MPKDGSKEPLDIVIHVLSVHEPLLRMRLVSVPDGLHLTKVQVGGSLGGLAAGVALKAAGHNVTICERNPTKVLEDQGAGVVAGGDTQAFFDTYDRTGAQMSCSSQKRLYLDKSGKVVHEEAKQQKMTSWDTVYYILRAHFDGIASDYCKVPESRHSDGKSRYAYDHNVTSFHEKGDQVEISYKQSDGSTGTMTADLLIGSDGPSSMIRETLLPNVKRTMAGYCALRGTVPENEASDAAKEAFQERFTFFHDDGIQILAYLIPGPNGDTRPGHRLMNFVWYKNFPPESKEFKDLMTDKDGGSHRYTLPPGTMRDEVWEEQKRFARERLPPQFLELVEKTKDPFAQAVTDVIAPFCSFCHRKVVLMGDALAGFRPHTVASTSQAAFDAMQIARWVSGEIPHDDMVRQVMPFARLIQRRGVEMGNRSQFGEHVPLDKHIEDRNRASTARQDETFPAWTTEDLP